MNIFIGFNPRKCTHWMWSLLVVVTAILTPILTILLSVFIVPLWICIIDDLVPLEMEAARQVAMEKAVERDKAKRIQREKESRARESRYRKKWSAAVDEARRKQGVTE